MSFSFRRAFLIMMLCAGVWTVVLAELWRGQWIDGRLWFTGGWILFALAMFVWARKSADIHFGLFFQRARVAVTGEPWTAGLLGALFLAIVAAAWFSAPNNYDAMTYRLPKVFRWWQDGQVGLFATSNFRQILHPQWTALAFLNMWGVFASDRFFVFVQTVAWLGNLAAATLVCEEISPKSRSRALAAVFCATLPMAVLQASSVQVDLVAAFWALICVYFLLLSRRTGSLYWAAAAGAALGLAILAKVICYFFLFPFVLWWTIDRMRSGLRKNWKVLAVVFGVALAVNISHFARNYEAVGSVFGSHSFGEDRYLNETVDPKLLASNVVRNFAVHLQTPSPELSARLTLEIRKLHERLGLDPDDLRNTIHTRFFISRQWLFEDHAGNPVHLILILLSLALAAWRWRALTPLTRIYLLWTLAGFVLFSLVIKWQIWNVRFHLVFFVLCAPWVAGAFETVFSGRILKALSMGLVVLSFPWALYNETRPLVGEKSVLRVPRDQTLYYADPHLKPQFDAIIADIRESGAKTLGLAFWINDWEYPLWKELKGVEIRHVYAENFSERYDHHDFYPDAVLFSKKFFLSRGKDSLGLLTGRELKKYEDFVLDLR